jgi:putative hydrolase of the HAD superfamily
MPGMKESLESIKKSGLELGILSNAQFYTPLIFDCFFEGGLKSLGFSDDLTLFSYMEKMSKPDIRLFGHLAGLLEKKQILPGEAVFVGNDMLKDIMPAAVSGFKTILFAGDRRSLRLRSDNAACKDIKPDVIVNSLSEIINFIQEG